MPDDPGFLSGTENLSMPCATALAVLHYPDVAADHQTTPISETASDLLAKWQGTERRMKSGRISGPIRHVDAR